MSTFQGYFKITSKRINTDFMDNLLNDIQRERERENQLSPAINLAIIFVVKFLIQLRSELKKSSFQIKKRFMQVRYLEEKKRKKQVKKRGRKKKAIRNWKRERRIGWLVSRKGSNGWGDVTHRRVRPSLTSFDAAGPFA